ncbi:MAG: succinylglutamate desuccinylase/aspartoacylase family protein [Burkholderiales bacterium]|nr:succinylglutamate desuccinylase/aspartoacylase family protein [Burkholderiales bacterium]
MRVERHHLLSPSVGTRRELLSFHYGQPGSGQKVYLQASLHADELPGMLVLHHLKRLLADAESIGAIAGEIVVVPVANPIGLSQTLLRDQLGRFEAGSGENFNRLYPDFFARLVDQIEPRLGQAADENKRVIRAAMRESLANDQPDTELASLRHTLTGMAVDADVVLDLHCDYEAILHIYTEEPYIDQAEPLYRYLGAGAVLTARGSGGASFDEAMSGTWWRLAEHFAGRFPIPLACLGVTIELRGKADVSHELAQMDAFQLFAYLRHRGVILGEATPVPPPACEPTPLAGSETLHAPHAGVIAFLKQVGDWVEAGDAVAEIVDPLTDTVTAIRASVSGCLYARENRRYATRGMDIAKVAGRVPYRSGYLLTA